MTIKLARFYIFICFVYTLIWTQQANIISQKISIENSYQKKLKGAIGPLLGEEKFLVIVSIEFSTIGGTLKNTNKTTSPSNMSETFIPGLPTVPSNQGNSLTYGSSKEKINTNNLNIGRVDIIIGMNATSINGSIKQEIKSLVETIIPETKNCEDCIKIQAMQFQSDRKNQEIETLKEELESLQTQIRQSKLDADKEHLDNLEKQLTAAQTKIDAAEAISYRRELDRIREDSIRFAQLIAAEKSRKKQDSIRFINTEERLEKVMENKLKSDSIIIREAMDIMKVQAGISDEDESIMGMRVSDKSSSIMSYVLIIFLIISLMVVTFLAANNKKPKTIYLKPKKSNKEEQKKKKKEEIKEKEKEKEKKKEKEEIKEEDDPKIEKNLEPSTKSMRPDEDAMRSELKSLRQTAVSLTVGEKEGASNLIKEWLEDNPNKDEDDSDKEGEE